LGTQKIDGHTPGFFKTEILDDGMIRVGDPVRV
jgi:hypothetical protein